MPSQFNFLMAGYIQFSIFTTFFLIYQLSIFILSSKTKNNNTNYAKRKNSMVFQ